MFLQNSIKNSGGKNRLIDFSIKVDNYGNIGRQIYVNNNNNNIVETCTLNIKKVRQMCYMVPVTWNLWIYLNCSPQKPLL